MFLRLYSSNLFHQSVSQNQNFCGKGSDQKNIFSWVWNLIVRKFQKVLLILCLPEVQSAVSPSLQVLCISPNSQLRQSLYLEKCVCLRSYLNISCNGIQKVWNCWKRLQGLLISRFKFTFRQITGWFLTESFNQKITCGRWIDWNFNFFRIVNQYCEISKIPESLNTFDLSGQSE